MKGNVNSNFTVALNYAITQEATGTYYTTALDHGLAPSALFHVSCNEYLTSFVATLQHSDNGTDYTDEVAGAGNTVSLTLEAVGSGNVNVPNPRRRYSRLKVVLGGQSTFGCTSVLGPIRSVSVS